MVKSKKPKLMPANLRKEIPRQKVSSSNIRAIGYSKDHKMLTVEFHGDALWSYYPVTEQEHEDLMYAGSIGQHFNAYIKNNTALTAENLN